MSILAEIVRHKPQEVAALKDDGPARCPGARLRDPAAAPATSSCALAPAAPAGARLVAEVKKASPSRGVLQADLDPVSPRRLRAGTAGRDLVLTDAKYFSCSLDDLRAVAPRLMRRS